MIDTMIDTMEDTMVDTMVDKMGDTMGIRRWRELEGDSEWAMMID